MRVIDWIVNTWTSLGVLTQVMIVFLILWGAWELIQNYRRKQAATALSNEAFNANIRKAQLIDVRDGDEYNVEHILGARSMPYVELQQRYVELRKDMPIYLYAETAYFAYRAALFFKKERFYRFICVRRWL